MNRLPITMSLISLAAAIGLWLVASWLEGDSWSPDAALPTPGEFAGAGVRPDSSIRTDAQGSACSVVEDTLREKVAASQYCTTDDDCTLFDYGYPIECLTSVAKSEITALRYAYRDYEESCAYRVYYDCPTGQMERQAVCRSNRCAVELQSTGILEEETLEYLGIDPRR